MPRTPVSRRPERAASYVISLRPAGDHAAMRRAAARRGLGTIALSPWRIAARDDDEARRALAAALDAPLAVFTSPPAVRAAAALMPAALAAPGRVRIAVGAGTRAALE
ncbi:uroporphyrinogen-III synthase, partial [Luteimonas sp. Y-2-2-4F]|nr:uroporphyrinogen-III synthase [Luteimonas sp. Y-2-2-4F]